MHGGILDQTAAGTAGGSGLRSGRVVASVEETFVGRGRSARVYAVESSTGPVAAKKLFVGSTLAKVVHQVFSGADNPYVWNREALAAAHHRRQALSVLVQWWFPKSLRVADSHKASWNDSHNVNELHMEFVDGRGPLLRNPCADPAEDELADLRRIMRSLQARLIEAGFDGAAWQAGYYNPVATSNFLSERRSDGSRGWVWVDLESGVPALFSANPFGLLSFYLPRSFKHGRPLFDDVDVAKLKGYLETHDAALQRDLGSPTWTRLQEAVDGLSQPDTWRRVGRIARGIEARFQRGQITAREADHYRARPIRWVVHEWGRAARGVVRAVGSRIARYANPRALGRWCVGLVQLILSERRRAHFARMVVGGVIARWHRRKQLSDAERESLEEELHRTDSSVYLADFGMHLAIKPIVKLLVWLVIPLLYGIGAAPESVVAAAVIGGGSIGRTLYTSVRIAGALPNRAPKPWLALLVGLVPVAGNAAFPLQVVYDGAGRGEHVAKFIIYALATRLGEMFPIWGGPDTLLEHRFNRLAHFFLRPRAGTSAIAARAAPSSAHTEAP